MTILALDISLQTGFAFEKDGEIRFGTRNFEGIGGCDAKKGSIFAGWVEGLIDTVKPDFLVVERPFIRHQGPTRLLFGLVWEALRAAESRFIPVTEYAPISIKKFITGSGKAKKPEVMEAVRKKGYKITTDDEADAVALLLFHLHKVKEESLCLS